jgi:hypothetical protein
MTTSALRIIPIALIAFALAGCSGAANGAPTSIADETTAGVPESVEIDPNSTEASAVWIEKGETFAVVTWGSSSCVPVPIEMEAAGDMVTIEFEPSAEEMCTADMTATTHSFTVPEGMSSPPTSVGISAEDWPTDQVLPLL